MPYTISANKLGIKSFTLINIKANGYAFINVKFAILAKKFLSLEPQLLPSPYIIKGFDKKLATLATKYIEAVLLIDRRHMHIPLIILSLKDYNIILD